MRLFAVLAAALLVSSCTWVNRQLDTAPPAAPPTVTAPRPDAKPAPHRPHADRPAPPVAAAPAPAPTVASPAPDYGARCRAMADNRADDARQLGVSAADQAKIESDTYRDCMAQSVK
jgi:hypothetical protein